MIKRLKLGRDALRSAGETWAELIFSYICKIIKWNELVLFQLAENREKKLNYRFYISMHALPHQNNYYGIKHSNYFLTELKYLFRILKRSIT